MRFGCLIVNMLVNLSISNFALIESLEIEFGSDLNVLTGETGAGKSIIIDAINLLLGERSSTEAIRSGAHRAAVEGTFRVNHEVIDQVQGLGEVELDNGHEIEINVRRELQHNGRSRVLINDQVTTAAVLKNLAPYLVQIHGQGEQHGLLSRSVQLEIVDEFANTRELRQQIGSIYAKWKSTTAKLEEAFARSAELHRQREFLEFQLREIEALDLRPNEDEELMAEHNLLSQAEKIIELSATAYSELYEADDSVLTRIAVIERKLQELNSLGALNDESLATLETAIIGMTEVADGLRRFSVDFDYSTERLAEVETRLAQIERLKRKYGASLTEVEHQRKELVRQLSEADEIDALIALLQAEVTQIESEYLATATALSGQRLTAIGEFERLVEIELKSLKMKQPTFRVQLNSRQEVDDTRGQKHIEKSDWSASGIDRVEFLFSANQGEKARPLTHVASGGELSRLMLTLRTLCSRGSVRGENLRTPTLIFDEIDIGVSGQVAQTVGRKMRDLSHTQQTICVTHQPQIARYATHHFHVDKEFVAGRTQTSVRLLNSEERIAELAQLIGGTKEAGSVKEAARWLIHESE